MAGHSKWANIKFRKAAQDSRRGKLFSKLIREVTIAARSGAEVEHNPRLRTAVEKALAANMARDVINRAIQRGSGAARGEGFEDVLYEAYGPGGVAIMIECSTDNRNRTVSEVRYVLSKYGGNLGTEGSVGYMFNRLGIIQIAGGHDEDYVMEVVIDAGADDIETTDDGEFVISTSPDSFSNVVEFIEEAGLEIAEAGIEQCSTAPLEVSDDHKEQLVNLLSALDEVDDVQEVYTNAK